jgi:hypothetical protein
MNAAPQAAPAPQQQQPKPYATGVSNEPQQ